MKQHKLFLIFRILLTITIGVVVYFVFQNYFLKKDITALNNELFQARADFASTTNTLKTILGSTEQELVRTIAERNEFERKYYEQFDRVNLLYSQVEGIQGTVGDLQKLSQTDPELLKKYSKIYFLNENFIPESFIKIDPKYTYDPKSDYLFYSKTWPFLESLLIAAKNDDIDIKINSAYRSFGAQAQMKSFYKITYGSGANQFSADQGYSEHQLGTTIDFSTSKIGGNLSDFDRTKAYQWLLDNGFKYGFILSYPENNKYYIFEPWHWRFVGRALAEKLREEGKNFYDLDQREIDKYLINFFD